MLYKSKPQLVEAVQWTGDDENLYEVLEFAPGKVRYDHTSQKLYLFAGKEGDQDWVPVSLWYWLVHPPNDDSDVRPVDPDYFAKKYERAT